jgi:hypothetical protein
MRCGEMLNSQKVNQALLTAQKNEITEHWVYQKLSQSIEDLHNGQDSFRFIEGDDSDTIG